MSASVERLLLAVERPTRDVVVIRVAGQLDPAAVARLLRCSTRSSAGAGYRGRPGRVVIDLADVWFLGAGGLDILRAAAEHPTVDVLLPGHVTDLLPSFSTFRHPRKAH